LDSTRPKRYEYVVLPTVVDCWTAVRWSEPPLTLTCEGAYAPFSLLLTGGVVQVPQPSQFGVHFDVSRLVPLNSSSNTWCQVPALPVGAEPDADELAVGDDVGVEVDVAAVEVDGAAVWVDGAVDVGEPVAVAEGADVVGALVTVLVGDTDDGDDAVELAEGVDAGVDVTALPLEVKEPVGASRCQMLLLLYETK
jgi:hypothetical protein